LVPENNLIDEKPIPVLGWDVGGAHLKAALLDERGVVLHVIQVACPLWRGLTELERAVDEVLGGLAIKPTHHAVTMTGELVDLFESRAAGVNAISQLLRRKLAGTVRFYAGLKGFIDIEQVALSADSIASANWLASACFWLSKCLMPCLSMLAAQPAILCQLRMERCWRRALVMQHGCA